MSNIKCITSTSAVGCTFIEWSVLFLSNRTEYYYFPEDKWIPLSINPVQSVNAHGHLKNHPWGFKEAKTAIEQFKQKESNDIFVFYPIVCTGNEALQALNYTSDQLTDPEILKEVLAYMQADYNRTLTYCYENDIPVVYVGLSNNNVVYKSAVRYPKRTFLEQATSEQTNTPVNEKFDELFFSDSLNYWTTNNLTNIWDHRERLALSLRPFEPDNLTGNFKFPYLWINSAEMWAFGEMTIKRIMDFYNLPIDNTRLEQWRVIYRNWQQIQAGPYNFANNVDHIVESIVNDYYYELPNLTFEQEVVIQHLLIYKYNLNLKTWNLTKFPNNTQDLHKLLEDNIHIVDKLY